MAIGGSRSFTHSVIRLPPSAKGSRPFNPSLTSFCLLSLKVVRHLAHRYATSTFGEFRSTLLGLFSACAYERNIVGAANRSEVYSIRRLSGCEYLPLDLHLDLPLDQPLDLNQI